MERTGESCLWGCLWYIELIGAIEWIQQKGSITWMCGETNVEGGTCVDELDSAILFDSEHRLRLCTFSRENLELHCR